MMRRNRAQAVAEPDPALIALVEKTGARARAAGSLDEAISIVLEDVANATRWTAGHAWVPASGTGAWISSGLWYPEDGIRLGGLRRACVEALPFPARGHLALALHMEATQWVGDLAALTGTPLHDAAHDAGVLSAIACPVYANGRAVALLEWYLATDERPHADVPNALSTLSAVLSEVAERPVPALSSQGTYRDVRETLKWVTEDGVVARLLSV